MTSLYPYQDQGARFLAARRVAWLCDDMGLGKTRQAIAAADRIGAVRILVLCTASGRAVWLAEFEAVQAMRRTVAVILKAADVREMADVVIVNYDRLPALAGTLRAVVWDVVILDEAHALKEPKTKRAKLVLGKRHDRKGGIVERARRVWCLTGTPVPNWPHELWPLLHALAPSRIDGASYRTFLFRYCKVASSDFGHRVVGARNLDELNARTGPIFLRRLADQVLDLPGIRWSTLPLSGHLVDDGLTVEVRERLKLSLDRDEIPQDDPSISRAMRLIGEAKAPALAQWVLEALANGLDKIVIMAWHRSVLDILGNELAPKHRMVRLDGGSTAREREYAVESFQNDPKTRVFTGNIRAAGEAITLTAASELLFAELSWTPGQNAQAAKRIYRIGQKRPVHIRTAVLHRSLDEAVVAVLRRKTSAIVDLFKAEEMLS